MSVELRTDMLHPGRMLGFFTCDMDKRILMPAPFEADQSLDWQGPWRPEIPT